MLEKLKAFLKGFFEQRGIKIPDDKSAEFETALREFIEKYEKENPPKPPEKPEAQPEAQPDMTKAIEELVQQFTEMTGGKKQEPSNPTPPTPTFDAEKFGEALAKTLKPISDTLLEVQRVSRELAEKQTNNEKNELNIKIQNLLEKSWKSGKISSEQIKDYKELLGKNYDVTAKVIELLPDNQVIAKQNEKKKFSLDGTSQPEQQETKDKTKEGVLPNPAKSFTQTKWGNSAKPVILQHVLEEQANN